MKKNGSKRWAWLGGKHCLDFGVASAQPAEAHHRQESPLQGTTIQAGLGPIFSTVLRGLTAISDRLTDAAVQLAPADASPAVVRVAVNAGLVLLALSFVKSLLSVGVQGGCCYRRTELRHGPTPTVDVQLTAIPRPGNHVSTL